MMNLKLWPLKSSSKGNATVIYNTNTKILVDCGISGKILEDCLERVGIDASELDAIVITHEHSDHTKGVGVISRKYKLPVYANIGTWKGMRGAVGKIDEENIRIFETGESFYINDIEIKSFPTPHDAAESVGYVFRCGAESVAIATDMGKISEPVLDIIKGSNTVLLEANYDPLMLDAGRYPYELKRRIRSDIGHLCNDDSGELARALAESGTREIILGHLSEENNFPQIALATVKAALCGMDVCLSVALSDGNVLKCENLNTI